MKRLDGVAGGGAACDWAVNAGDPRVQVALLLFRLAGKFRGSERGTIKGVGKVVSAVYLVLVEWTWGIEIPWATQVGPRLRIFHGTGIVINADCRIGSDVVLRQGVCLGNRTASGRSPSIGDGANIGANAVVLGDVRVGRGALVGAGAVVLTGVPDGATAVGNPAHVV